MPMASAARRSDCFLKLPYDERQKIVMVDDVYRRAMNAVIRDALVRGLAPVPYALYERWSHGNRPLFISRSQASAVSFPHNHPQTRLIYVGNPVASALYYTAADFHRATFEHKCLEAARLLTQLGASRIRVEHVSGWSNEFAASLSLPLGKSGATADSDASAQRESRTRLLFEWTLRGHSNPELPAGLLWYPHEETWKFVADARLRSGLQEFSLILSYNDDFGVNAGLKASSLASGLKLGGRFTSHTKTTWKLSGEFPTATKGQ